MSVWDLQKINAFIKDQVEENINLDYKAADALQKTDGKKKDISKDVSALANAAGGIIIYGIKEFDDTAKRHLPERIDPVNRTEYSKEWLEQIINSNIHPRIEDIVITPVTVNESNNSVVYIVDVPQSATAHQAADKRYYKRYNFESAPMEDYEIRDIMNRSRHPDVCLQFVLERKRCRKEMEPPTGTFISANQLTEKNYKEWAEYSLRFFIRNKGKVVANFVNFYIDLPPYILRNDYKYFKESRRRGNCVEFYGDNTVRDIVDVKYGLSGPIENYGPSRFDPVLPGTESRSKSIHLLNDMQDFDHIIYWSIYADNAEMKEGSFALGELISTIKHVK